MSSLFQSIKLRSLELKNRVIVSPMCQYSAVSGNAQPWHNVHLGQLMMASSGMLVLEATAVEDIGRITPACLGLYNNENHTALAALLSSIKSIDVKSNTPICIQLAHAGRKASSYEPWNGGSQIPIEKGGWECVAPSALPHLEGEQVPRALSETDLVALTNKFLDSLRRSEKLGLDAVELHCAHGYLLHEFLSPIANRRTDKFGGSLENRMRFPLQLFKSMRDVWPAQKPMGVRLSASDWDSDSSWHTDEAIVFSKELEKLGCDWIDVSSGGVSSNQKIDLKPGYQVDFAEQIKRTVNIPIMTVGLITEAKHAESIIANQQADMVALARAFLYNPRWVWHAAAELGATVDAPKQYWRSSPHEVGRLFGDTKVGQR